MTKENTGNAGQQSTTPPKDHSESATNHNVEGSPVSVTALPVIDANILRALAEEADGFRDKNAVLVFDATAPDRPFRIVNDTGAVNGGLLRVRTDNDPQWAPRTFRLIPDPLVELASAPSIPFDQVDAIFLTAAAVDKFVVPYYARMRKLDAVKLSRDKFVRNAEQLAVCHLPDSVDDTLKVAGSLFTLTRVVEEGRDPQPLLKAEFRPFLQG